MDIGSGNKYPASALSNFAPHPFEFEGVQCNSMEGLLQAFKYKDFNMQVEVCKLVGKQAKFKGKKKNKQWKTSQTLWWRGVAYKRDSREYQLLLDNAFEALSENTKFRKALAATGNAKLTHSMGRRKKSETVLTTNEFCSRLERIRETL